MSLTKEDRRKQPRKEGMSRKKNALVIFKDGKEYWTTQNQFWQWVRDKLIIKAGDNPLRGNFIVPNNTNTNQGKDKIPQLTNVNHSQRSFLKKE